MIALRTLTPAWVGAPIRLRAAREALASTVASRFFLDRQLDFWRARLEPWALRAGRARVVAVRAETPDVKTFVFAPGGAWPGHRAGQYVPIEVEVDGVRERRCYSLSSAPGDPLAITVKRVGGGRVSSFLHDHVTPGMALGIGAPAGELVLAPGTPGPLLLLSGGSGATPLMSIVRDLARRDALDDVVYLHAARSRADVIFGAELASLALRHRGLKIVLTLDAEASGPLDAAKLRALVPDFAARRTLLCGPGPMMDAMTRVWDAEGARARLRSERFHAPPIAPAAAQGGAVTLRLSRSGRSVVASPGTLLEQLERAGERPAFGCRIGICQTCRCRKRTGTVEDLVTGALSSEPEQEIRLCVSVARSDLELTL